MADHQEILSVSQAFAHNAVEANDYSLCELLQIFQIASFVALDKYAEAIKATENCCQAAINPFQLALCERLVGMSKKKVTPSQLPSSFLF